MRQVVVLILDHRGVAHHGEVHSTGAPVLLADPGGNRKLAVRGFRNVSG